MNITEVALTTNKEFFGSVFIFNEELFNFTLSEDTVHFSSKWKLKGLDLQNMHSKKGFTLNPPLTSEYKGLMLFPHLYTAENEMIKKQFKLRLYIYTICNEWIHKKLRS